MKVNHLDWSLKTINQRKNQIDPSPQYQRGSVWNTKKKRLLIDSILRGYDIPKIYFRKIDLNGLYEYEVTDGQQRLRTIWGFFGEEFVLGDCIVNGDNISGFSYSQLPEYLQELFNKYILNIVEVVESTNDEIRNLFARLQMGVVLNAPEKRNAIYSNLGSSINMIVLNHRFFKYSRISRNRFNQDDFLAHALALVIYDNKYDLKADVLDNIYREFANNEPRQSLNQANLILDKMNRINDLFKGKIRNKWTFVDIFYFLYRHFNKIEKIDYEALAQSLNNLEKQRRDYNYNPEALLDQSKPSFDKDLYDYIINYKYEGALSSRIEKRAKVLDRRFKQHL